MSRNPDTRPSLISRLQVGGDEAAWEEFVAIYRPVIVRMAVLKGLQLADAEDLAQQVLVSVSKSIGRWEQNPKRARFRTWLQQVVRNATFNMLSRRPKDQGHGGTTALFVLEGQVSGGGDENDSALFDAEWRREALRWASDAVRGEFQPATWDAFWLTAIEGMAPAEAAVKTGKSLGSVYVARTRVMKRIQAKLRELAGEEERLP